MSEAAERSGADEDIIGSKIWRFIQINTETKDIIMSFKSVEAITREKETVIIIKFFPITRARSSHYSKITFGTVTL